MKLDFKQKHFFEVPPEYRTNLGGIFMTKLSKQDKIEIYHI